ncbi:MAG: hypothetical protein IPL28_13700 [Chloroflexi bacterium]|nr:hypothetical protein [Chloroflexota bacterium]
MAIITSASFYWISGPAHSHFQPAQGKDLTAASPRADFARGARGLSAGWRGLRKRPPSCPMSRRIYASTPSGKHGHTPAPALALPLKVGDELLGVLDMQKRQFGCVLRPTELPVFEALADQLDIALRTPPYTPVNKPNAPWPKRCNRWANR